MDEREYLEGLLEACEAEMRGRGEAVSDFLREQPDFVVVVHPDEVDKLCEMLRYERDSILRSEEE
jgi:hypothetical protein